MVKMDNLSVVVGMSGGVDSSTTAWYFKEHGYRVVGVTVKFLGPDFETHRRTCCDEDAVSSARSFCERIGIEHRVVDAVDRFEKEVIDYFLREYRNGRTPNPCVICNEKVKFPVLAEVADEMGARWIATGHYARIIKRKDGRRFIAMALDMEKDQSYFLYRVPVSIIERTIFPLGTMTKEKVRELYSRLDLEISPRKESQDVCFLPEDGLKGFLEKYLGYDEGKIVDINGRSLGRHMGTHFYTIGQRRGLGVSSRSPLYVKDIDAGRKEIVLSTEERLFSSTAVCEKLKMRSRTLEPPLFAKIRYRHKPGEVEYCEFSGSRMKVYFREPQRAVTPGQSLVLYRDGLVLGGGIIVESSNDKT